MLGLGLPGMVRETNPAELRFAGCAADRHGADAEPESIALQ